VTTYTIAYNVLLFACVPDGDADALERELRECEEMSILHPSREKLTIVSGLTLTDEEPEDESRIVWRGHDLGWLTDKHGTAYDYAIR
jgi:hypothetical protein